MARRFRHVWNGTESSIAVPALPNVQSGELRMLVGTPVGSDELAVQLPDGVTFLDLPGGTTGWGVAAFPFGNYLAGWLWSLADSGAQSQSPFLATSTLAAGFLVSAVNASNNAPLPPPAGSVLEVWGD